MQTTKRCLPRYTWLISNATTRDVIGAINLLCCVIHIQSQAPIPIARRAHESIPPASGRLAQKARIAVANLGSVGFERT